MSANPSPIRVAPGHVRPQVRRRGGRGRRAVGLLALSAVLSALAACGDDDETTSDTGAPATTTTATTDEPTTSSTAPSTTAPPATVEEALAGFAFGAGMPYAGDCAATTLEEDTGKWCSTLSEDRGSTRIYGAGPTFSEYTTWLLLTEGPAGWTVEDSASAGTMDDPQEAPW